MPELPLREIETLLVLAEELHFGRTAERLRVSQSRVSQLVAALERKIGARLVERTSRRVALTEFGLEFVGSVGPRYRDLVDAVDHQRERARPSCGDIVRLGFQGTAYETVTSAFGRFIAEHPGIDLSVRELPLGDPFGALRADAIEAAVVLLPVQEPDLTVGYAFPPEPRLLAVGRDHVLAHRERIEAEDLARADLVALAGDAPDYWHAAHTPRFTPLGRAIASSAEVATIQEGLAVAASGRHAMLVCRPTAQRNQRTDIRYLPVDGLGEDSRLALVWRGGQPPARLRRLAALLAEGFGTAGSPAVAGTHSVRSAVVDAAGTA
ncbi:LysR family transcriptional regulator [Nocardia cyriacigeorgica]|uniref:LysR family transcriptional regulator n=1 Tax=Nocardia cyriacigeorgica TaxID=135487 RepID=UPI0018945AF2|nr:LysR family transcriptional regulator [Nocardia cyriacigeorgica]MBF6096945.1 LysR family transcriptional regulator [Nocardia cyriacigeorgica]MBF6158420.1 LysR family transcriptional regulator [Nocardia cyriacigeorgica]MBF6197891.1 LysR family transcriptional regulator [Nocardia cyriacigeorgica]MBF6316752.1 LysR family transcriptional regulator [Nocardia cyriacigeorgica]MBF6534702.1 LysR family transcriptional regulator [Nocardia cyriacigeorgica]